MNLLLSLAILAATVTAHPTHNSAKTCKDYSIPITVTSTNFIWGLPKLTTDFDAVTFTTNLATRPSANISLNPFSGIDPNATATYTISGTFCSPTTPGIGTVLVATHGLGFDRSYWAPEIQPANYSFVDFAITQGHSIFYYDRLGIGKSSAISGYVSQLSIQTAILEQLVLLTKAGKFTTAPPEKVVLVGHSFGSIISNSLLISNPSLVDGAVLTGIGYAVPDSAVSFEGWNPRLARLQEPGRFRQLDGGYVTWVDIFANVNVFFKFPFYDPKVVKYAEENKQPFSLMEIITLSIKDLHSPNFTGPVLVISGESDLIFCNGFCPGILEPEAKEIFSASKNLVVFSQPGSGHGINLSLNATGAFGVITGFLESNGF